MVRDSSADIASNAIGNNADGIEVGENSTVQLGEDSGASIYDLENNTSSPNAGVAIRCTGAGVVDGRIGSLSGAGGAKNFSGGCIDSLTP